LAIGKALLPLDTLSVSKHFKEQAWPLASAQFTSSAWA
jgi:hypothetical protein